MTNQLVVILVDCIIPIRQLASIDLLSHSVAVPAGIKLVRGDIRNQDDLESIFLSFKPDAVFHFSASIEVGESCADPLKYYDNNVCGTVKLLQVMQKHGTKNPYGDTKLAVETMLKWCDEAWGLKNVCLRYFNACGADASGDIGRPSTRVTSDPHRATGSSCLTLEVGRILVKEIINAARKVTGHPIPADLTDRRPGDPDTLIAASDRAETILGWKRQYNTIEEIVATAELPPETPEWIGPLICHTDLHTL
ncbi:hypothetical protein BSLG_004032 [Batrachochytrium salamandrivorans]|nr:hypothetical protein BSLG_004032 [Batrachochytrium salamandrivorans]